MSKKFSRSVNYLCMRAAVDPGRDRPGWREVDTVLLYASDEN